MSKPEEKIIYEPHPVTPERKAELRNQGYKIIDAAFDPNPKAPTPKFDRQAAFAYLAAQEVTVAKNASNDTLAELVATAQKAEADKAAAAAAAGQA